MKWLSEDSMLVPGELHDGMTHGGLPGRGGESRSCYRWEVTEQGRRRFESYRLTFRTLGGTDRIEFAPGIGVVAVDYSHNRTPMTVHARMVGFRRRRGG